MPFHSPGAHSFMGWRMGTESAPCVSIPKVSILIEKHSQGKHSQGLREGQRALPKESESRWGLQGEEELGERHPLNRE